MLATFGADGPLMLAEPDPLALCAAMEQLLDDRAGRERSRGRGIALAGRANMEAAAEQVEHGLRARDASRADERSSLPVATE